MSCEPSRGYTLVIAEKPKSAKKIAEALAKTFRECKKNGVRYWVFTKEGQTYVVASAAGHLFGLDGPSGFPVFEAEWKPLWEIDKKSYYTRKYFEVLKSLAGKASKFVNACDYDVEGSVIGYMIIKYLGGTSNYLRAKFSSLTKQELESSFRNLRGPDYEMVNAGIARHKVDWLWGINVSRALMASLESVTKRRLILSAGRVQSPLLQEVVDSAFKRLAFVPLPKFRIELVITIAGQEIKASLDREFENLNDVNRVKETLVGSKVRVVEVNDEESVIPRPTPFNLGDLQEEAGRVLKLSPYRTERIAESLYLDGLISYPRTNSQKLPKGLNVHGILEGLRSTFSGLVDLTYKLNKGNPIPREGEKEDPAHPAIYPTGEKPRGLSKVEYRLFELVVRRFLATVSVDAKALTRIVTLKAETGDKIELRFRKVTFKGWLLIYPYRSVDETDKFLEVRKGDEGLIKKAEVKIVLSKPPELYSRVGLLRWMESAEIGTEATRGRIIETLFERKYVKVNGGKVWPTPLGIAVSKVLKEYFGHLTSVELTRKLEKDLDDIRRGKRTVTEVERETIDLLKELFDEYNKYKLKVGETLASYLNFTATKKCKLCELPEYSSGLCELHHTAKLNLEKALELWEERGIERKKALSILLRSKSVGKYVKDLMRVMPTDG
ncbi:MAG: DNA topoisomerase I [Thermoprotei archaeon]